MKYPEMAAGGFTRVDGTVAFYARVNALLAPEMRVLDLGAGRGAQFEDTRSSYRTDLITLQGKVREVVGADVDRAVMENPRIDSAVMLEDDNSLPFDDFEFDLVLSDWVIEHIENPAKFTQEISRILKPGGWFCARTPNKWGMTAIGATLIPERLHKVVLNRVAPHRHEQDVFPKFYRLNTVGAINCHFPAPAWLNASYVTNSEPPYVENIPMGQQLINFYWRLTPQTLHTDLIVFCRKNEHPRDLAVHR